MAATTLMVGRDLGRAICKHLGIDYTKHTVRPRFIFNVDAGEPVSVTLTVMLSADDFAGIARAAKLDGDVSPDAPNPIPQPSPVR